MKRWNYKIATGHNWNRDTDGVCRELEIQGANGWELVSVVGEYFYFKREIISPQPELITYEEAMGIAGI
jgi:hypothetical protein